jgi:protein-S-isoprenylcysteine O-methyltransferase Ste14
MSWVPAFKIGLWNAWILMLYYPFHPLIMIAVDKVVGTGEIFKKMGAAPYEKGEKRNFMISLVVSLLLIAYSIFLPLQLGKVWFYLGLTIYLAGMVLLLTAYADSAATPLGQPFIKGMYKYSRHPMLVSNFITFVGVSVASASWVFLLLSVVIMVLFNSQAVAEERGCLETYGVEYQDFMNRTPRWIGIPKLK